MSDIPDLRSGSCGTITFASGVRFYCPSIKRSEQMPHLLDVQMAPGWWEAFDRWGNRQLMGMYNTGNTRRIAQFAPGPNVHNLPDRCI